MIDNGHQMASGTLAIYLLTILFISPATSWATNGYFQHGLGVKEQSIAGAVTAQPQSSMTTAINPAAVTATGNRLDLGFDWFKPNRAASVRDGSGWQNSGSTDFLIPEFGLSYQLNENLSLGLVAYANGGLQTDWAKNFFGNTPTYSELSQLILAPTLAYQITPRHSFGVSINYVQQTFEARGLQNFAAFTPSGTMNFVTDQGKDDTCGWGLRLGYLGQLSDKLSFGAYWQPRTEMGTFSRYRELLAEQGALDIPETYGLGIAFKLAENLQLAADFATIRYAEVPTLGNDNNLGAALLGSNNGPGFNWRNVNIVKLGIDYTHSPKLSIRVGWNHSNNPIRSSATAFNILSPATITDHLTCGLSWNFTEKSELSLTYWHGFEKAIRGDFAALNNSDAADLKMEQNSFSLGYGWRF